MMSTAGYKKEFVVCSRIETSDCPGDDYFNRSQFFLCCHCEEGQSPDAAIQRPRRASRIARASRITIRTGLPRPDGLAMTRVYGLSRQVVDRKDHAARPVTWSSLRTVDRQRIVSARRHVSYGHLGPRNKLSRPHRNASFACRDLTNTRRDTIGAREDLSGPHRNRACANGDSSDPRKNLP